MSNKVCVVFCCQTTKPRHTGVPAMFNTWEEDENQRDMHDKRSRCLLNRRPMLTLKVHLVSSKVYLVNLKQNFLT